MANIFQMQVIRKNNQTHVSISPGPVGEIYAMLHGAVSLVAKNTNQSVDDVLNVLRDLDAYAEASGQA